MDEETRVKNAQALRSLMQNLREGWPMQLELIGWRAKVAKARFDALRREGFDVPQALQLCLKEVEL